MTEKDRRGGPRPGSGRLQLRYQISKTAAQKLYHLAAISGGSRTEELEGLIDQAYDRTIKERTMHGNELYRDILSTVIENDRLSDEWDADELEVEIDAECRERGMTAEQTAEAVEYAQAHATK